MASSQILHFTHPHLLQRVSLPAGVLFNCNGCNTLGYGISYRCSACDFDLHEECATAPLTISCHHHPQHHLTLKNRPKKVVHAPDKVTTYYKFGCDVCGKLGDGLSYTCEPCDFDVHPRCTSIPMASTKQQYYQQQQQQQGGSEIAKKAVKIVGRIILSSLTGGLLS